MSIQIRVNRKRRSWAFGMLLPLVTIPSLAAVDSYAVQLSIPPLDGYSAWIALDFVAGGSSGNNYVTVTDFASTDNFGEVITSGSVSGSLTQSTLRFGSESFFNEYLQLVKFANGITHFTLNLHTVEASVPTPDSFSFYLLGPDLLPLTTPDPSGANALFAIDLSPGSTPQLYGVAEVRLQVSPVPEPSMAFLLLGGVGALALGMHSIGHHGKNRRLFS